MSISRPWLPITLVMLWILAGGCGDGDGPLNANAGEDASVRVGESPHFDGCNSEGDIVNYQWLIRDTPPGMTDDIGKSIRDSSTGCSFVLDTAMVGDEIGDWEIELIVSDAAGETSRDSVTISVTD